MKITLRLLVALLLVSGMSACSLFSSKEEEGPQPAELVKFDAEIKVKTLWSKSIGDGAGEKYIKLVPALDDEKVFVADVNGLVMAIDRNSGKKVWKVNLREPVSGGVGAGSSFLFLGTKEGKVIALSQADGSVLWESNVSSEILAVPQTNDDVVVVQTLDEKVYAFDLQTGKQRWYYESILPALTLRGSSTPIVNPNVVLIGLANGKVVALNADTGLPLWEQRVSVPQGTSELERMTDVDGDLLLQGDMIYATSYHGGATAIELSTARVRWQKEISSFLGAGEGFGNLYVVDANDHIIALDLSSGDNAWEQSDLDHRQLTAPVTFGNYLVVGDFEGYLHFMSQVDGHFVGRKRIDGDGIRSTMVVQGNQLFVYGNSGKVVALEAIEK